MAANQCRLWPELSPSRVLLSPAASVPIDGITSLAAKPGPGLVTVRAHRDQILLVRPDRYVAAAFWPQDADAVVAAFRDVLGHCQDG